jgi:hypothetical protein
VPSFISACGVSCRVRTERVKPYGNSAKPATDSPRGPCAVRVGSPPPGATRGLGVTAILLLHFVYASHARMSRSCAWTWLEAVFTEIHVSCRRGQLGVRVGVPYISRESRALHEAILEVPGYTISPRR